MDIADKFQEIRIFLAHDGFVSVLEEVAAAFVSFVEYNSVACHQTTHDLAEWCRACT